MVYIPTQENKFYLTAITTNFPRNNLILKNSFFIGFLLILEAAPKTGDTPWPTLPVGCPCPVGLLGLRVTK